MNRAEKKKKAEVNDEKAGTYIKEKKELNRHLHPLGTPTYRKKKHNHNNSTSCNPRKRKRERTSAQNKC